MGGQLSAIAPGSKMATTTLSKGSGTATLHTDRCAERGADPDADPD